MKEKLSLHDVTLVGIDCLDVERLRAAMNICEREIDFAKTKILSSIKIEDKRFVEIDNIDSIEKYSLFCIRDLHKYIDTEFALIIQYDGFILNPKSWKKEFLNYDYIGAPWLVQDWSIKNFNFPTHLLGQKWVGNGGFNLRSKKLMQLTSEYYLENKIPVVQPEDVAICVWHRKSFEEAGIKFAPINIAEEFSVEGGYTKYDSQFGFHSFKYTNIDKWFIENSNSSDEKILLEIYKKARE